jgi:adenine-specific DNA-methyltransferase
VGRVRYIGSKARVVDEISEILGHPNEGDGFFVDAFCGTGVVAGAAADLGWSVRINDHLLSSASLAVAQLLAHSDVPFKDLGGYDRVIKTLNGVEPVDGFFWREYSPASELGRMYFSEQNARYIDSARTLLNQWRADGALNSDEDALLTADLISAAARVANIAGTYGCFLTYWTGAATRPIIFEPRLLRDEPVEHEAFCRDVVDVPIGSRDVAYFDPPYTKRQYAAYYHINETLAYGDEPELIGKTGLRAWREKASDYCYKLRALRALTELITNTPARRILLSYSNEGHVRLEDLAEAIAPLGELEIHELGPIGRYRPNEAASAAADAVTEYVVDLQRSETLDEEVELVR